MLTTVLEHGCAAKPGITFWITWIWCWKWKLFTKDTDVCRIHQHHVCWRDCGPRVYVTTVVLLLPGWNSAHRRNPGSPNKPQCAALKQILVYISKNRSCNNKANPNLMMCKRSAKACSWKTNMREWKRKIQVHPSYVHFPFHENYQ